MVASLVDLLQLVFVLQVIACNKKKLEKRSSSRADKTIQLSLEVRVRAVKLLMMMTMMQRMEDARWDHLYMEPCPYQTCHY